MRNYPICNQADKDIFDRQLKALQSHIPDVEKTEVLMDIDSSETAILYLNNKQRIVLRNSYYIGAVYIESDVDLEKYFA